MDTVTADRFSEDEERIDRIARRLYGSERGGTLERVLQANPGLAALAIAHGTFVPRGTQLVVPAPAPVEPDPAYRRAWE